MGKFTPAPRLSAVAGSAPPLRAFLPWRDLHSAPRLSAVAGSAPRSAAFCRGGICTPLRFSAVTLLGCFYYTGMCLFCQRISQPFLPPPVLPFLHLSTSVFFLRAGLRCRKRGRAAPNGPAAPHAERAQNEPYGHRTGAERQHSAASPAPTGGRKGPAANAARRCAFPCFPEKICI